jgi:ribosomal protein S18 acetylase RimI-like enzyme
MPEIRDCTAADLDILDQHVPGGAHRGHYEQQQAGARTLLVAWSAGRPVGTAVISWEGCVAPTLRAALPDAVEIAAVHVDPDHRGRGIGTALITAAEHRLAAAAVLRAVLGVDTSNPRATALYTRLGYTDTGHRATIRYTYTTADGRGHTATEHVVALGKHLGPGTPSAR